MRVAECQKAVVENSLQLRMIHAQCVQAPPPKEPGYEQEYIIERESILLHYSTVLQPFTGVMTFVMIFTNVRFHSLHSDARIAAVGAVPL